MERFFGTRDYHEFCKSFGRGNEQQYLALRELKKDTTLSWEDMKKLKFNQFDDKNKAIILPATCIKQQETRE